ncbi:MAG: arginine repressor [Clostridia bacterium]|nr:arginine repressor [Clostridia bacterium]
MSRKERQRLIIELIERKPIVRQEDIAEYIISCGIPVTQATISRDIHNLGLVKQNVNGILRYVAPKNVVSVETNQRMSDVFVNSILTVDRAKNIVVIKTLSGMAQAAAAALDSLHKSSELVGSIAGDDTIMVIMRTDEDAENTVNKFLSFNK